MRGKYKKFLLGGSSSIAFAVAGILLPSCESLLLDPQGFLTENTCNIFNCDTLFFLQGEHVDMEGEHVDMEMEGMDEAEGDEHQH